MIARIIVNSFGSMWNLKRLCIKVTHSPLKKLLIGFYKFYQYENNSSVAWNSTFEGTPCLPHGIRGIFISGEAKIGPNCVIFQQVTIGSNKLSDSKGNGAPVIGKNCYIGAGAKIVGNVKIGNNVRIGANAVVYKDVPDNSVVFSGEQKTVKSEHPMDNRYYSFWNRWLYYDNSNWIPVVDTATLSKLNQK
jgi:serine O-acetyltransferase